MKRTIFLTALFFVYLSAGAQQKRILLEKYTSAFCGSCPNGHLIAEELAAAYPELVLAFHHSSVDGMANPYSTEWRNNFGVLGTPMGMVDRSGPAANQIAVHPLQWEDRILERLAGPACVGLEIQGAYHPVSRELSIDIASTFTERPPGGELRLNLMITEDSVIHAGFGFDQSNYYNEVEGHPLFGLGQPIYFYPHHHVVREIVDGAWGTAGVFPEQPVPGQAYTHHYDYTVPWEWRHEKVNLVLFVSLYEEEDVMQRQVLNVVELPLFDLLATAAEAPPAEAEKFSVFPNPAAGNVHFRVPPGTYRIELYTASGKLAFSQDGRAGTIQADISGMASGLYLARALTPGGIFTQKIAIGQLD